VVPAGLSIDAANQLYVIDEYNPNQITVVPPHFVEPYVISFASNSFTAPSAIAAVPGGQGFIVTDVGEPGNNPRSSVFTLSGVSAGLNFPNTAVGSQSAALPATIVNIGNLSLSFLNPEYTASGQSADFPVQSTSTCPEWVVLGSAQGCSVNPAFAPVASGSFTATLTFSFSTGDGFEALGIPSVTLTGTAP
jgi:hypothetical protein